MIDLPCECSSLGVGSVLMLGDSRIIIDEFVVYSRRISSGVGAMWFQIFLC